MTIAAIGFGAGGQTESRLGAARRATWLRGGLVAGLALMAPAQAWPEMVGHGGMVRSVAVSPDGGVVLTGSFDYTAKLWNFVEQAEVAELNEHFGPVNAVTFLPDGSGALTASDDGSVILWNLATRAPARRFVGHGAKVMAVAVSRNGKLLASGGWDRTVRIWDLATGENLRTIEQPSNVNALAFGDDGTLVVTGSHDGALRLWNVADGSLLAEKKGHDWGVTQISVSPEGGRMLSSGTDEKLRLWDLAELRELYTMEGHDGPVFGAVFSPDGATALSAGRDGYVILWDLAKGESIRAIRAHEAPVWAVAFTPDGRFGISASSDERVRVWHLATGDQIGIADEGASEPQPWLESSHPGAKLFRKCARCHSLSVDGRRRSGPHFAGLFGRRAGSVPGYKYSAALDSADFVWSEETLGALFREGPDAFIPGTKMPMQRIGDDSRLAELIDYMEDITAPPAGAGKVAD